MGVAGRETSVQISVRKDVYERLKKSKRPGESFSDEIDRLIGSSSNLQAFLELRGIARHPEDQAFFEAFEEGKRQVREGLKHRRARLTMLRGGDE